MCKHCEHFIEDKDFVHRFMELTTLRANERAAKDGVDLYRPITADDIEVRYDISAALKPRMMIDAGWRDRIAKALAADTF